MSSAEMSNAGTSGVGAGGVRAGGAGTGDAGVSGAGTRRAKHGARGAAATFWRYFTSRFPFARYSVYIVLWSLAVTGALARLRDAGSAVWPGLPAMAGGLLALFVTMFFMRTVDEIKDLDYDRVFKPDRPLVTGEVHMGSLWRYLAASALLAVGVSLAISPTLAAIAAGIMAYSLFLLLLERASPRLRDSMFANILLSIQLKTGLVWYVVVLSSARDRVPPLVATTMMVVAFVLAYLHWEIARKTVRREFARPGEKLYSSVIGAPASLAVAACSLVAACALVVLANRRWGGPSWFDLLYLTPFGFAAWGAARFIRRTTARYAPGVPCLLAYLVFLVVPIACLGARSGGA